MASKKSSLVSKNVKNPLFSSGIVNFPDEEFTQGVLLVPPPKESEQLLTKGLGGEVDTFLGQDVTDLGLGPLPSSENVDSDQTRKLLPPPPPTLSTNFRAAQIRPTLARPVDQLPSTVESKPGSEPDFKQIPLDDSIPLYNPSAVLRSSQRDNSHELNRSAPPLDTGVPLFDPSRVGSVLPPHATKRPLTSRVDASHGPTPASLDPAYSSLSKHISTCSPSLVIDSGPHDQGVAHSTIASVSRKSSGSSSVHELHALNSQDPRAPPTLPLSSSSPSLHSLPQKTSHLLSQAYQSASSFSIFPSTFSPAESAISNNQCEKDTFSSVPVYSTTSSFTDTVPLYPIQPQASTTASGSVAVNSSLSHYSNPNSLVTPSPIRFCAPAGSVPPTSNFSPSAPPASTPQNSNLSYPPPIPGVPPPLSQSSHSEVASNKLDSSENFGTVNSSNPSTEYSIPSFLNPLNLFKRGSSPSTKTEVPQVPALVAGVSNGPSLPGLQPFDSSSVSSISPPFTTSTTSPPVSVPPSSEVPSSSSNPLPPPPLTGFQASAGPLSSLPKIHHSFSSNPYSIHSQKKVSTPAFKPEHYFTPIPVGEVAQADNQESFQISYSGSNLPTQQSFLRDGYHENLLTRPLQEQQSVDVLKQNPHFSQPAIQIAEQVPLFTAAAANKIEQISQQPLDTVEHPSVIEGTSIQKASTVENLVPLFAKDTFSDIKTLPNIASPSTDRTKVTSTSSPSFLPSLAPLEHPVTTGHSSLPQQFSSVQPPLGPSPSQNPPGPPPTSSQPNSYRLSSLKRPTYAPVPDLGISSVSRPSVMSHNQSPLNSVNQGYFVPPTTTTESPQTQIPTQPPLQPSAAHSYQESVPPNQEQTLQPTSNLGSPFQPPLVKPFEVPSGETSQSKNLPQLPQIPPFHPPIQSLQSRPLVPSSENLLNYSSVPIQPNLVETSSLQTFDVHPPSAQPTEIDLSSAQIKKGISSPDQLQLTQLMSPGPPPVPEKGCPVTTSTHQSLNMQPSPILPAAQPSPVLPPEQPSPVLPAAQPSPVLPAAQPSPVLPPEQPSPVLSQAQPSPVLPQAQPPPVLPQAQPSSNPTQLPETHFHTSLLQPISDLQHHHHASLSPLITQSPSILRDPATGSPPLTSYTPAINQPFTAMAVSQTYRPVYHHWFYSKGEEKKNQWHPFSMADSLNLEQQFTTDAKTEGNKVVATDGGRYDVDVEARKRKAVYWHEQEGDVRRCSWFVKGPVDSRYQPYDENIASLLEEEFKTACTRNEWNRRVELADGEVIIIHSPNAIAHHQRSSSPDPWGNPPPIAEKPRVVKRGLDEFDIPEGEPTQVDHLLLLVHGIGKVCDLRFRSLVEVVDDFRNISVNLVGSHFRSAVERGKVGRVEVLPVEWHRALHTDAIDQRLAGITLPSIPKARQFTNETLLDILFYTSPVFCEKIVEAVGEEVNRVYSLYLQRNPGYKGGVSLGGHSLGSLILFDMLCHQKPPHPKLSSTPSFSVDEEDEDVSSLGCLKTRAKLSRRMSYLTIGTAGTGQPFIVYPQLKFQPRAFFALGSPIGMFVTVRGIESLGEEFKFPTCPSFFNIFHPNDPVAYRMEGLINSDMAHHPAVLIPHHKGRKRMHLELKETMAHLTAAVKQKLLDSVKNTWNTVSSFTRFTRIDHAALENQVDKVLEDEILCKERSDDSASSVGDSVEAEGMEPKVGVLNGGRRIDYVLQEAPLETFNQYISAVRSHLVYWESEDTMLLILKEIYSNKGITADCQVSQPILPFDLTPEANADPGTAYSHYTVSPSPAPSRQVTIAEEL